MPVNPKGAINRARNKHGGAELLWTSFADRREQIHVAPVIAPLLNSVVGDV